MEEDIQNIGEQIKNINTQLENLLREQTSSKNVKPLGKYHDIYLLLIGFMLTALVGGFISYAYQKKMYDYQKKAINYENKQNEMSNFYKNVSNIITTRYLFARRLISDIQDNKQIEIISVTKQKYYESVDEWSKNDAYNRAFIQNNFDTIVYNYYCNVSQNFVQKLHNEIRKYYDNNSDSIIRKNCDRYLIEQNKYDSAFFSECSKEVFNTKEE